MLIDVTTRWDEWRTFEVQDASPSDAAYAAVLQSHTFLTPTNHRRRPAKTESGAYTGRFAIERTKDISADDLPRNARLRRMIEVFGSTRAGDLWISGGWRVHHPHGAAATDGQGRRWIMVRRGAIGAAWECVTDLRERESHVHGPHMPRCCGHDVAVGGACPRCGGAWVIAGEATPGELRRLDAVALGRWTLRVVTDLARGLYTAAQSRDRHGGCGRGRTGSETFRRKVVALCLQLERAACDDAWPDDMWARVAADPRTLEQAAADLVRVAEVPA